MLTAYQLPSGTALPSTPDGLTLLGSFSLRDWKNLSQDIGTSLPSFFEDTLLVGMEVDSLLRVATTIYESNTEIPGYLNPALNSLIALLRKAAERRTTIAWYCD